MKQKPKLVPIIAWNRKDRKEIILQLLSQNKTNVEIGKILKISHEMVRLLIIQYNLTKESLNRRLQNHIISNTFKEKFKSSIKRHLHNAGIRKCGICKLWCFDISSTMNRCRPCNAKLQCVRNHKKGIFKSYYTKGKRNRKYEIPGEEDLKNGTT